ncbi:MAG: hypothetical protein IR159_02885 [Brevundimonas sp.]|nr:hypothetical protein [Brevundimonas sp.]
MMIAALTVAALLGGQHPPAAHAGPLTLGQSVRGELTTGDSTGETGAHFDCYSFRGTKRQALTVHLQSPAFTPMLVLRRGATCDGNLLYVTQEAGAEVRVNTNLNYDEVYSLTVRSVNAGETGAYTLTLGDPPAAARQGPARPQTAYQPERIREGCGYVPGRDRLFPIEIGLFYDGDPPFADHYGRAVRVNGQWTHPDQSPYPDGRTRPWYIDSEPITVRGRDYVKYGLPRILGLNEAEWFAELDGLAVVAEAGAADPEVVYVLVDPADCGFQPYQRTS